MPWACPYLDIGNAESLTINFTYDNRNRVTNINAPGATDDVTIGYDPTGHVTSMTNSTIAFTYDYDASYRLVEKKDTTNSLAVEYEYNSRNMRTKMTDPSSQETTYSYNELNRLTEINDAQSETYEFELDNKKADKKDYYKGGGKGKGKGGKG